jgi:hypothetical protein
MHALNWIQTRSPSNETTAYLRLREHGHWNRHTYLWVDLLLTEHSQFNTKRHLPFSFRQKYQYLPVHDYWMCGTL